MSTKMVVSMTKEDVIAKLKERLEVARNVDEKNAVKHRKDEQKTLDLFKAKLRKALLWDWPKLKEIGALHIKGPLHKNDHTCTKIEKGNQMSTMKAIPVDATSTAVVVRELTPADLPNLVGPDNEIHLFRPQTPEQLEELKKILIFEKPQESHPASQTRIA